MKAEVKILKGYERAKAGMRISRFSLWFDNSDMEWRDFHALDFGYKIKADDKTVIIRKKKKASK